MHGGALAPAPGARAGLGVCGHAARGAVGCAASPLVGGEGGRRPGRGKDRAPLGTHAVLWVAPEGRLVHSDTEPRWNRSLGRAPSEVCIRYLTTAIDCAAADQRVRAQALDLHRFAGGASQLRTASSGR